MRLYLVAVTVEVIVAAEYEEDARDIALDGYQSEHAARLAYSRRIRSAREVYETSSIPWSAPGTPERTVAEWLELTGKGEA